QVLQRSAASDIGAQSQAAPRWSQRPGLPPRRARASAGRACVARGARSLFRRAPLHGRRVPIHLLQAAHQALPPSSRFPARARRPGDWLRSHDSRPATLSPPRAKLTPHADAGSTRRPARSARPRLLAPIPDRFLPYSSSASRASIAAVETHAAVRHHLNDVVTDHTVRDAEARSDLLDAPIVHAVENEGLAMALGQPVETPPHGPHPPPAP